MQFDIRATELREREHRMPMFIEPRMLPQMAKCWMDKGYKYTFLTLWTSTISDEEADLAPLFLDDFEDTFIEIIELKQPDVVTSYNLVAHFDEVFSASFAEVTTAFRGRYLRVFVPTKTINDFNTSDRLSERIVNTVRLHFGAASVERRVYELKISLLEELYMGCAPGSELNSYFGNGKNNDSFVAHSDFLNLRSVKLQPFSEISCELLSQAFRFHHTRMCFFYLWCVIEVEIGDGKQRREFCSKDLQSDRLGDQLKRLHNIRNKIVHDGNLSAATGSDIALALEFIRLKLLPTGDARKKLVNHLEKVVSSAAGLAKLNIGGASEKLSILTHPICPPELRDKPPGPLKQPFREANQIHEDK